MPAGPGGTTRLELRERLGSGVYFFRVQAQGCEPYEEVRSGRLGAATRSDRRPHPYPASKNLAVVAATRFFSILEFSSSSFAAAERSFPSGEVPPLVAEVAHAEILRAQVVRGRRPLEGGWR
jgi:hypothetical protein